MLELGIPYFVFRDIPSENSLLVKIFVDRMQFGEVQFEIGEKYISILSEKFHSHCFAKIRLPANIIGSSSNISFDDVRRSSLRCYKLLFCKKEYNRSNPILDAKLTSNLDVISKFLSWTDDFQEESAIVLRNEPEVDDEISKALLKKLTLTDSNSSAERELKVGFYGFASRFHNELTNSDVNWRNVINLDNPDLSDNNQRYIARWENERQSFDVDHYLADYFFEKTDEVCDTVWLNQCIKYKPYWVIYKQPDEKILNPQQMILLAGLPCKNFKLTTTERLEVLHSLFDIMLAYAYDNRINGGVFNSESSWNICKLSSTLSWLQAHKHPRDVIISFFRRSISFPLARHLLFSKKVVQDVIAMFNMGRRQLLNCLISIYELFDDDEDSKIFNKLYIEDYLIWIQQVHPQTIVNYVKLIKSCELVHKKDIFPTLPQIESAAIAMLREENEGQYEEWLRRFNYVKSFVRDSDSSSDDSNDSSGSESS